MSNANNNKGCIDTRRAGGRPKLARYERRNHHHKVSYNDEEENIIQYIRRNGLASLMMFICTRQGWMPLYRRT